MVISLLIYSFFALYAIYPILYLFVNGGISLGDEYFFQILALALICVFSFNLIIKKYYRVALFKEKFIVDKPSLIQPIIILLCFSAILFFKELVHPNMHQRFFMYSAYGGLLYFFVSTYIRGRNLSFWFISLLVLVAFWGTTVRILWPVVFLLVMWSFEYDRRNFLKNNVIGSAWSNYFYKLPLVLLLLVSVFLLTVWFKRPATFEHEDWIALVVADASNVESIEHFASALESDYEFYGQGFFAALIVPYMFDPHTYRGTGKLTLIAAGEDLSSNLNRSLSSPLPFELYLNFRGASILVLVVILLLLYLFLFSRTNSLELTLFKLITTLCFVLFWARGDTVFAFVPSVGLMLGGYLASLCSRRIYPPNFNGSAEGNSIGA
ncbi:hypothetical protein [Roseobacter sp. HKCCA0882]|uniref:hypothetical protein n=1 Tax=Roseobacter sp. HKCCA0882 TaxID=3120337 RepID=UPI0030ED267E